MLTSCLVDDTATTAENDQGPNFVSFTQTSTAFGGIADGTEYDFELNMELIGPTAFESTTDVSATISVDASSTAIEGTHFRLDSKSITLSDNNNYLGQLPITLLTDGIIAPLDVAPVIVLNVSDAQGNNVVGNGKKLSITLNYLCPSNLAGFYHLTLERDNGATVIFPNEQIVEVSTGYYKTESIYRWAVGSIAPDQGFNFFDVCDVISVPNQDLAQGFYSNDVYQTGECSVNPDTGVIIIRYAVDFSSGPANCIGTYVPL